MRKGFWQVVVMLIPVVCCAAEDNITNAPAPPFLSEMTQRVQRQLSEMDRWARAAAQRISETELDSDLARDVLRSLLRYSGVVDCSSVTTNGIMLAVEPKQYQYCQGADISGQEQVVRLRETGKPVFSESFKTAEGLYAADLEWPVFRDAEWVGSVSVLICPVALLRDDIVPRAGAFSGEIWAMEPGGRILYDADQGEIGRNLFSDDLYEPYEALRELGRRIQRASAGFGEYSFMAQGSTNIVTKQAWWSSVGLHGTMWRLVATREKPAQDNTNQPAMSR